MIKTKNSALILTLWGILFAKCFTIQYIVIIYKIPINTVFYVWFLSIGMASTATLPYLRAEYIAGNINPTKSWLALITVSALAILALPILGSNTLQLPYNLGLSAYAWVIGIIYLNLESEQRQLPSWISSLGWICGGSALPFVKQPESLALFSSLILIFTVLPALILHVKHRREIQAALRALHKY